MYISIVKYQMTNCIAILYINCAKNHSRILFEVEEFLYCKIYELIH